VAAVKPKQLANILMDMVGDLDKTTVSDHLKADMYRSLVLTAVSHLTQMEPSFGHAAKVHELTGGPPLCAVQACVRPIAGGSPLCGPHTARTFEQQVIAWQYAETPEEEAAALAVLVSQADPPPDGPRGD
jgi:hypothetical protein